jgi:signal transduction histidine kinase
MTPWIRREESLDPELTSPAQWETAHRCGSDYRHARELLRMASNNLIAPLNTIRTLVDISREYEERGPSGDDRVQTVLSRVAWLAQEATMMVQDVLALEQLETESEAALPVVNANEEVDVEDAIDAAILLQKEALDRAHCPVVVTRAAPERLRGHWKRASLVRLFSHLFHNASWRAPGAPAIVDLSQNFGWLRVLFSDGAPLRQADVVGDSFWRLARAQEGNGLGLWILHRTVAELGGEMEVQADTTAGATFDIRIPR